MSSEERTEGQRGADAVDVVGRGRDLVDDLDARIAELDAIAWNLPRGPKEVLPATEPMDLDPAA
jgi:hypothetical protein